MDQLIKSYVDDLHALPEIKKEYDAIQEKLHYTQKVATLFCTLKCGKETEAFLNSHSEQKEKLESRASKLKKKIESIQSTSVDFVGKLRLKATESNEMAGNIRGYIRDLTESAGEIVRKIQKNLPAVDLNSCSLEALNEQISIIQNELGTKEREVNEDRNKLLPIEKEVLNFKTELDEYQGEVNNLQERLDSLSVFSFAKKKNLRSLLNDKKDVLAAKTDLFKEIRFTSKCLKN